MKFASALLFVLLIDGGTCFGAQDKEPKTNVVVIVADDLGYADLSFLANAPDDIRKFGTPSIDALAKTGTYFGEAYSTAPICSPSRCGLITGSYQQRWGNYWYGQGGLPKGRITLPQILKQNGYRTVKLGKTHLNGGEAEHPLDHGFEEYFGFNHHTWDYVRLSEADREAYERRAAGKTLGILGVGPLVRGRNEPVSIDDGFTTELFTKRAIDVIENRSDGRPFFIELEFNAVHMPTYVTHPQWSAKVGLETPPWDRKQPDTWDYPYWDPKDMGWDQWHKKWGHLGEVDPQGRKRYLSHLIAMDHYIGQILDALDGTGSRQNTLIVFLSDNGGTINTYSNNSPLRGWKYMFGEGGIRIPMIVSMPGKLPSGQSRKGIVSAMDVMPTALEMAGIDIPKQIDGSSLVPMIRGTGKTDNHEFLCWSSGKGADIIRKGPWKLSMGAQWTHLNYKMQDGVAVRDSDEATYPGGIVLFNLNDDPSEQVDVAADHPEIVSELKLIYRRWRSEMSDPVRMKKK